MTRRAERRWRREVALVLVGLIAVGPTVSAAAQPVADKAWSSLVRAPLGAEIQLTLHDKSEVRGRLAGVQDDRVSVREVRLVKGTLVLQTGTDEVTFLRQELAKAKVVDADAALRYVAVPGRPPDLDTLRRVIGLIGVGKVVDVRTAVRGTMRGRVIAISTNSFTIGGRDWPAVVTVALSEVTALRPAGVRASIKIASAVAASVGTGVLLSFLAWALR